ncbi:hypothetical protein [Leptolyngbya sp. NIES-2104]|uniref:hypothetical protein n=1 Tax=Leptolyngbya sp. NIES-2104 TaxID=1552121 RepID=UPI0006ECC518|nr:hypothetical protein [Leptolyngbya sp. NIES-2104]GAP93573.1 hypothetical protein NIES2104_00790 [Leptolyngbya sp. NIES-2104]
MTTKEQLIQAIEQAPDAVVEEVFHFLQVTQTQYAQQQDFETTLPRGNALITDEPTEASEDETLIELMERLTADMTEEEIAQLPKDGAEQHDHYIYGSPKRPK